MVIAGVGGLARELRRGERATPVLDAERELLLRRAYSVSGMSPAEGLKAVRVNLRADADQGGEAADRKA